VIFDLHSHSTASDGVLSPRDLIQRAAVQGVQALALTDHDELSGLAEAEAAAREVGMTLIPGVEISVSWDGRTVHIVGLRVDANHAGLRDGLASNRGGRGERARRIGESLAKSGIAGAYEGAYALAENKELISRTHFARFLVEKKHVKDIKTVFKKYLTQGKPGYVAHQWASLPDAVDWIRAAGGTAVLAHPGRYVIGRERMARLLTAFKDAGGEAIEVVTGSHRAEDIPVYADFAERFGLAASVGSDFHAPGEGGRELGRLQPLPRKCRPVWETW
jgi:hypothetical protein